MSRILIVIFACFVLLGAPTAAFADSPSQNKTALVRLRTAIGQDYSYRDRLKLNWAKLFAGYQSQMLSVRNNRQFADLTARLLTSARDPHIWLKIDGKIIPTYQRNYKLNFNPRVLPQLVPHLEQHGTTVLTGGFNDGIKYVAITTWQHKEPQAMNSAIGAVQDAVQSRSPLIIDVRANFGGDENLAKKVAGYFVGKPKAYAMHVYRSKGMDMPAQKRVINPVKAGFQRRARTVVLMGPANISSCESFLLMMRIAGAKLIGEPSGGSSGNPQPHDLGNGVVVMIPSWRNLSLDGKELEGKGITPDIRVDCKNVDFSKSDPVLDRALQFLRKGN